MSQMIVAVFSLLCFLYCQYVLHSSQSMVIRVIVNFFSPSGSSELLLYRWYSALFVVVNGICVCCVS